MAYKSWDPFHGIVETKTFPHARTLRTSFLQKLWDAFHVVAGDDNHPGLMHYFTLFFAIPVDYLFAIADDLIGSENMLVGMAAAYPFLILGALKLSYYTASWGIVLISLPVVGAVHLVAKYLTQGCYKEQAMQGIQGTATFEETSSDKAELKESRPTSLQASLHNHGLTEEDIEMTSVLKNENDSYYYFEFSKRKGVDHGSKNYKFKQTSPENDGCFSTFFRLNIAGITAHCEAVEEPNFKEALNKFSAS